MSFNVLVNQRNSCRAYLKTPVEREMTVTCLEAARLAPSACNSQPWRFVAVDDPEKIRTIADCVQSEVFGLNRFADQVPVYIVVVEEPANLTARFGAGVKNQAFSQIDIGLAVENLCLSAADQGLGTCIIGWFSENRIRLLLGIPRQRRVRLVIALGYPAGNPAAARPRERKPSDQTYSFNQY